MAALGHRRRILRPALAAAALVLVMALAAAAAPPARAADPAEPALAAGDAYVSPRVLGEAGPAAVRELREAAAELAADGRPVKLAIVAGPVGSPSMPAYARRLAGALAYEGTLVVTAPGRPVAAAGPRPPDETARLLRAARADDLVNPVERLVAAARRVAPQAVPGSGTREVLILLGLAGLGGAWAIAWGLRREGRHRHEQMLEARAAMRVRLDALRSRATALALRPDLPAGARAHVEAALGAYAEAIPALQQARRSEDVAALEDRVRAGLEAVAEAGSAVGEPQPPDAPFAGLCAVDPAHGPATGEGAVADGAGPLPLCEACREASERGDPPRRRLVPRGGRAVPFSEVEAPAPAIRPGGSS
jgi:hypothetical protein